MCSFIHLSFPSLNECNRSWFSPAALHFRGTRCEAADDGTDRSPHFSGAARQFRLPLHVTNWGVSACSDSIMRDDFYAVAPSSVSHISLIDLICIVCFWYSTDTASRCLPHWKRSILLLQIRSTVNRMKERRKAQTFSVSWMQPVLCVSFCSPGIKPATFFHYQCKIEKFRNTCL